MPRIKKIHQAGQVYLIVVFALTVSAAMIFILSTPLVEQVRAIMILLDSYQALASAEAGLEKQLLKDFKLIDLTLNDPEINFTISIEMVTEDSDIFDKINSTGLGKYKTERTLFYKAFQNTPVIQ
jgi:hypothetical protein